MAAEGPSQPRRSEADYGPAPPEVHPNIAALRGKHRAAHPDSTSTLQVESHALMVDEWPIVCPRFIQALRVAGVHCLTKLCYLRLDHHLLTALVERWCPQTNTFHLAVGEMTITLEDVAMILGVQVDGYPIIGQPVVGPGRRWQSWPNCCDDLLGSHPDPEIVYHDPLDAEVMARFRMGQARTQTCVPLRWLRWTFQRPSYEDLNDIEFRRHVRAYIMFIIGSFLLPDTSGNEVHLQYLPLLEDIELFSRFSLGGAVLAHLYRELNEATKPKRSKLSSCVHLLQIWSWEHIHIGRPVLHVPMPNEIFGYSVGLRWSCKWLREMPAGNVRMYRDEFDGLLQSQVIWEPYTQAIRHQLAEICSAGAAIWLARVPLICWKRVEWYLPDRVLRQFGCLPNVDVTPIEQAFTRVDGRGKADTDWSAYHSRYIGLWQQRRSSIVPIVPANDARERDRMLKRYMRWYKSWASLFLLKAPTEAPDTYYPRATTERQLRDVVLTADEIFQPFYGRQEESEMQHAINKFQDLMVSTKKDMFYTDTMYRDVHDDMGAGPSSYHTTHGFSNPTFPVSDVGSLAFAEHGTSQHFTSYLSTGPSLFSGLDHPQHVVGIQSEYQQWPNFEMNWAAATTSTAPTPTPQDFFPATTWNTPWSQADISTHGSSQGCSHFQNAPSGNVQRPQDGQTEEASEEILEDVHHRQRRRPDKYTPGSGAIPKRRGKKK